MTLTSLNEQLASSSGYITPHSVISSSRGTAFVTMIGAGTASTRPGGIVEISDVTGAYTNTFGPGPARDASDLGPAYMYDFDSKADANRGISTTFGPPALCGGGIEPTCLGDEVAVWDLAQEKVVQVANLGAHSGALEVRFIDRPGVRRAFINTPGTNAVWLASDDDGNGTYAFTQILGPADGLVLPVDMLLSYDEQRLFITNWFGNTVQEFDVSDPFHPVLRATVSLPHPNMLRLSPDGRRLYVSNSLLTPWDDDPRYGPPRNNDYGIWLFHVDAATGVLAPHNADGSAWVSFTSVRKRNTTGPAGPHMMFFDPGIRLTPGEH